MRSEELFKRAAEHIPGGVNSPVRAYGAIGIAPRLSLIHISEPTRHQ